MIAVTKAAADRGWVAWNPVFSTRDPRAGFDDLIGITVAVVELAGFGETNLGPAEEWWELTGFANVAEVSNCVEHVGDEHDPYEGAIYTIGTKLWFPTIANTFEEGVIPLDLPHAEPGGLALRLEFVKVCLTGCGISADPMNGETCCSCHDIGEPVSVVDWSGEIGRWER